MSRKPPRPWKPSEEDNPAPARPVGRFYTKPLGAAGRDVIFVVNESGYSHAIRADHTGVARTNKARRNVQSRY
ncbi:hypothetical protein SB782_34360, partial [Brevibacillus sp. SIMBA_076]|uniref:hypothetical protein n=1 Tax=Brevibacillus sp. SIMBA_076 TaxID=3085814 RepID=UPI00397CFA1F